MRRRCAAIACAIAASPAAPGTSDGFDGVDRDEIAQQADGGIHAVLRLGSVRRTHSIVYPWSLPGRVAAITGALVRHRTGLREAPRARRRGGRARRAPGVAARGHRAQIRAAGGRAAIVQMDVTREDDVQALVGMATREFGRLDIMICNAGFGYYGPIDETPSDVMQRMMDVNYMGTFYGARAALPIFRAQNSGHLIFISSIVGRRGIPLMGGYTATKAAQAGLAESLRAEFAGTPDPRHVRLPDLDADRVHRRDDARLRPQDQRPRPEAERRRRGARDRATASGGRGPRCIRSAISRGLTVLNALAPGFTDWFVRKYGRRRDVRLAVVPGGAFLMGSDSGQDDERPVHRVYVDAFEMSVHPVTRGEYARFLEATGHDAPRDWTDPALAGDDRPVVGVSWHDAVAYCAWCAAHGRAAAAPDRGGVGARRARRPRGAAFPVGRRRCRRGFPMAAADRSPARGR